LAELRTLLLKDEAVDLYALSIDPPATSRALAEKIADDGQGEVGYRILSDPGSKTVDAWGLRSPAYAGQRLDGIPHPAVYVLGKDGRVAWVRIDEDYRQRPSNAEIRAALTALGGK
jgi:peroxiredoxin